MIKYENFPKKCLKCHKTDVPFEKFQIAYVKENFLKGNFFSRRKTILYQSYSVKFPVCRSCKRKFRLYQTLKFIVGVLSLFYIIIIPITVILFFNPSLDFLLKILPISILTVLVSVFSIIVNKHPSRIHNYIEITKNGKVLIKEPLYEKEFNDYQIIKNIEDSFDINKFSCPKCGTLLRNDIDFCTQCGIDLRTG